MNTTLKHIAAAAALALSAHASAQLTFYEHEGFAGRSFATRSEVRNFQREGFNDRASSVVVMRDRWEVCEDARFEGRCIVLRPGRYGSLASMGMNDRVSSVRAVGANARFENDRYAPPAMPVYDNHRRNHERVFEADVIAVRAVLGTPTQRCWVEREQVSTHGSNANVPGAIVGALLGGVIGHQVGNGRGRDVATAVGAVTGAAVGANAGRNGSGTYSQDVQRCASVPASDRPEYWDVTYTFRGREHRMQMTHPPGRTVSVNRRGEPRT